MPQRLFLPLTLRFLNICILPFSSLICLPFDRGLAVVLQGLDGLAHFALDAGFSTVDQGFAIAVGLTVRKAACDDVAALIGHFAVAVGEKALDLALIEVAVMVFHDTDPCKVGG